METETNKNTNVTDRTDAETNLNATAAADRGTASTPDTDATHRLPVFNLIILDKSGSMHSVRREAVDAYNETLGAIKAAQEKYGDTQEQYVSLALFCNCGIDMVYDRVPAAQAEMMDYDRYHPCCSTPLFDAIGTTINRLKSHGETLADYTALVTIITDGYENSSREWTGEAVKSLISECREQGWMVSFIGAMKDAKEIAVSISIENVMQWTQTHEGTREMSDKERNSREIYFSRLNENVSYSMSSSMSKEERIQSRKNLADKYYNPDEE